MGKKKPKVFLIEKNYELLGDKLDWDDLKILDLCYVTRTEKEELAAILRMRPSRLESILSTGRVDRQVSLLLYQFAVSKGYFTPNPMPTKR